MNTSLAIVTAGVVPVGEVMPLLTEHITEEQITHISLLGRLTREEALEEYSAAPGEETVLTLLRDGGLVQLSLNKVELALQGMIEILDNQDYDVILVLGNGRYTRLSARNAMLLVPDRLIPPLVASIVEGHQVGILLPTPELLSFQQKKWRELGNSPLYTPAASLSDDSALVGAGRELVQRGADVLVLDSLGFHQHHRDLLQRALDVPVLLSHMLLARLASELLV
jgi:protein AroM